MKKLLFQDNLRELMKQKGFSQVMLAESTGISQSAISLYLRGKATPKAGELQRMADALSVSMDYLWRRTGAESLQESSYYEHKWRESERELAKLREALKLLVNNVSK
ncbi:helix-turn-helix transcriptional regulator [Akkermansia massiliensis]|jgi:transcriptional regulator with XRE-family HTH domain|uniref:Helix-turn-helix transcriptional regulator n=1 Tax=Akkermansia massiliensis TaxID=2927224 RepID=A0ABT0R6L8_9BACT|nr:MULTISPECIES: helix-turn-helix transcriptional regulator [Akkermansia]MBT8773640.1 helix-turn-helix transcriptional regulator [Akkermansia muciniphila]DAS42331.1 MAG TPA: Repressor protein CI [Bacteriophage sp.]MBO1688153.1 helix-turn-helix transcriptional regulator [Akkermansia sp. GGCC_0220]MBS6779381.1 helix-turn-helix transcriptional regulator [Akkermansia sp.]MBT8774645.1 helix-turn-helix transcriptional regulator [Akkermansia muciniphila]